jgi:hypothetical protein
VNPTWPDASTVVRILFRSVSWLRTATNGATRQANTWHPKRGCRQRAVKAISRSQSNDGIDAPAARDLCIEHLHERGRWKNRRKRDI